MQSTTVEDSAERTPPLPDLNQAVLDESSLESLFRDFVACTKVLDVTVKTAADRMTPQKRVTLDDAKALLLSNLVRGVQVRYLYDNAEWWDTLMATPAGVRVVRIRHG